MMHPLQALSLLMAFPAAIVANPLAPRGDHGGDDGDTPKFYQKNKDHLSIVRYYDNLEPRYHGDTADHHNDTLASCTHLERSWDYYIGWDTFPAAKCKNFTDDGLDWFAWRRHPQRPQGMELCEVFVWDGKDCSGNLTFHGGPTTETPESYADTKAFCQSARNGRSMRFICADTWWQLYDRGGEPWSLADGPNKWIQNGTAEEKERFYGYGMQGAAVRAKCLKEQGNKCSIRHYGVRFPGDPSL